MPQQAAAQRPNSDLSMRKIAHYLENRVWLFAIAARIFRWTRDRVKLVVGLGYYFIMLVIIAVEAKIKDGRARSQLDDRRIDSRDVSR